MVTCLSATIIANKIQSEREKEREREVERERGVA